MTSNFLQDMNNQVLSDHKLDGVSLAPVYASRRDIGLRIRRVCFLLNLGLVNLVMRPTRKDSLLSMSRVHPAILSTHPLFQNDVLRPPFSFLAPLFLLPELPYAASASGVNSAVGSLTPTLHAYSLFNGRHRHPSFFFLGLELGARHQVSVPPLRQDSCFGIQPHPDGCDRWMQAPIIRVR